MKAQRIGLLALSSAFALMGRGFSGSPVRAQERPRPAAAQTAANGDLQMLHVQGNVYMLAGAGANITVQVEDGGLVLVDTGDAASSGKVIDAIKRLSSKPIRYIINTQFHDDHIGGNAAITKALGNPPVIAHENVLKRLSATKPPKPVVDLPTDTFFTPIRDLYNGEAIQIFYQPADTDGASFVHFRRADVVSTGDIFMTTTYPPIDVQAGGDINKILEGINRVIDITVPVDKEENGTLVIPGHGRICDEADVVEYRDMLTIVRDRFQDAIVNGMSLAQVKAAKLTFDFDGRYGSTTGPWTTDRFVEAVYANLSASAAKAPAGKPAAPAKTPR